MPPKKVSKSLNSDLIPIIVESPSKIKKIQSIVNQIKSTSTNYIVLASCGHFRKLSETNPNKTSNKDKKFDGMGFSIESYDSDSLNSKSSKEDKIQKINIEYIEDPNKKSIISNLKSKCSSAKIIYLATDPDREGEAIAWHIAELLAKRGRKFFRIKFNSITKSDILKALDNPSIIDMNLVFAQQTRQIIDKWIGFKVSPLCWANVLIEGGKAKSAGRVQSPALKLIVDREREIINFKSKEYLTINAHFSFDSNLDRDKCVSELKDIPLRTYFDISKSSEDKSLSGKPIQFESEDDAMKVIDSIYNYNKTKKWKFTIEEKETQNYPPPPYTTLTILQDCNNFLKIKPEQTMLLLQKMYESGWITYHRTDSVVLSTEGLFETRKALEEYQNELEFDTNLMTEKPRNYTNKSQNSQEAHEAIRPTYILNELSSNDDIEDKRILKIYSMIYLRTLATQCIPQVNSVYNLSFSIDNNNIQFSITYSFVKNLGYKTLYLENSTTAIKKNPNRFCLKNIGNIEKVPNWLLEMSKKSFKMTNINLYEFVLESHFTRPPSYYTESSLIKELETYGIGRPSTYATILSKLFENNYIYNSKEEKNILHPTSLGIKLVDFLETKYKSHFMNLEYTQNMEKILDEVAEGKTKWTSNVIKFINEFPL